ncbi:formate dehydrogenase subunit delta [Lichenihabitans psoromatis]|uniref:formate dehydrogenase subunit delta n=1 Tax=Lichenihabitans psoromatis TaxID=2528642 RepID=UPI0010361454|nr:formate dehydrogenase subunit delta [Lichenihabitans psoromatis]
MNSDDKLIRMANQIANYFHSYPDNQAMTGIHDHVVSFWTPKMRLKLGEALDAPSLDPLVRAAFRHPVEAPNPAEKEAAGPAAVGEIGASDAG